MDDTEWRNRFKGHLKDKKLTQDELGNRLGVTQGAIGHWLNGRREINLSEFFRLCDAAFADAQAILFGDGRETMRAQVKEEVQKYLATDPRKNPHYKDFEKGLEKAPKPTRKRQKLRR